MNRKRLYKSREKKQEKTLQNIKNEELLYKSYSKRLYLLIPGFNKLKA